MLCKWSETYQAQTKEATQERNLLYSSIYKVPERPKEISSAEGCDESVCIQKCPILIGVWLHGCVQLFKFIKLDP